MTRPAEVVAITDAFLAAIDRARPGLVRGLFLHGSLCWGEFFLDSDVDFVAVLGGPPRGEDLAALEAAHEAVRREFPARRYEGFYCRPGDLTRPPAELGPTPVHFAGTFSPLGSTDVNLVTWHELAERGHVVRGRLPRVYTDLSALLDFTHHNLASYWRPLHERMVGDGPAVVGADEDAVAWATLGVARLHHLLARRTLTSKSGAGRYVVDALDPRWRNLAGEALRIREHPDTPTSYDDPADRGREVIDFLAWAIEDGRRLR